MAQHYTNEAGKYIEEKLYEKALMTSKKALSIDENNVTAYEQISIIYVYCGELSKLEDIINKSLSINPNNKIINKSYENLIYLKTLSIMMLKNMQKKITLRLQSKK